MKLSFAQFTEQWSSLHGDTPVRGVVGGWLKIAFQLGRVACRLRITANTLTGVGLLGAVATALAAPHWWAGLFLALSLLADGLDGSVAILSGKSTSMGAFLDSFADRVSEFFWAIALFRLGVPLGWVVVVTALAALQEYARARLASLGSRDVGVVTPAERPVRAIFLFLVILLAQTGYRSEGIKILAAFLLILQLLSFLLLMRYARRELK